MEDTFYRLSTLFTKDVLFCPRKMVRQDEQQSSRQARSGTAWLYRVLMKLDIKGRKEGPSYNPTCSDYPAKCQHTYLLTSSSNLARSLGSASSFRLFLFPTALLLRQSVRRVSVGLINSGPSGQGRGGRCRKKDMKKRWDGRKIPSQGPRGQRRPGNVITIISRQTWPASPPCQPAVIALLILMGHRLCAQVILSYCTAPVFPPRRLSAFLVATGW